MPRWIHKLLRLGRAMLDLVAAELAALGAELQASGRELRRALVLLALAAGILFWTLALLLWALVAALSLWMPSWAAALSVAGLALVVAVVLGLLGRARLRRAEAPVKTVQRRWEEQREWWSRDLLGGVEKEDGEDGFLP